MKTMAFRDKLQQGIYVVINPLVRGLIKMGLTPNAVTTIGLILNIGVAVIFIIGAEDGTRADLSYVGWAGGLILFAGLFDMLDGQVARLGNMSSRFGALYDSVLDRYSELVLFLGICYYLVAHHYFLSSLFAFIALIGSMMVSYTRARAEGLGIECKGGLMQRPERVVILAVSAIVCGIVSACIGGDYKLFIPGIPFHVFETISIFTIPITIMAVLTNITAINRLRDAGAALEREDNAKKKNEPGMPGGLPVVVALVLLLSFGARPVMAIGPDLPGKNETDTFPVPAGIPHLLFYIQRTSNINTIVYDLNMAADGTLNIGEPVNAYWVRYAEDGSKKKLNYIQKKFAYGLKAKSIGNNKYELRSVAYDKHPLYLAGTGGGNYQVYTKIKDEMAVLKRIYLKIEGGTFWVPNVVYVELKGVNPVTGAEIIERFKP